MRRRAYEVDKKPIERARVAAAQGQWWRFDRYEMQGDSIRPAPGARLEWYDPWDTFGKTRFSDSQPAYRSLLQLAPKLKPVAPRYPNRISTAGQAAVVEWCQAHGPLGVLLSRWEAVTVAPQTGAAGRCTAGRYVRAFGQTVVHTASEGDVGARAPRVLLHGLNDLNLVEEALDKTWSRFFPGVDARQRHTYAYPLPYSDEFCHLYAEPLSFFCHAARLFAGAIAHLARAQTGGPDLAREQALETINFLRRPISAVVEQNPQGALQQAWHTPSLLASFAEMFVQDIAFGRATRLCECCQLPFVSGAYQARYCSPSCRQRQQKRNVRAQAKRAKGLRAEGHTIRQIAAELNQDPYIVKGWLGPPKRRVSVPSSRSAKTRA